MEVRVEDAKKRKMEDDSSGNGCLPFLSKDELRALLHPLSKDQLVSLLVEAGFQYPNIADDVKNVASKDPAHRKLFVRGLAWDTNSETLQHAFEQYGEVEEGAVVTDKSSGKSRGFGFITFKHVDSVLKALKEPSKMIEGRMTVCNLAASGSTAAANAADQSQRKLYVGGLSYDTTNETLVNIFSRYGEIEEGSIAYEKGTNKSRGFAFVTFKTVEAARKALEDPTKSIDGRHVSAKLAIDGVKDKAGAQSLSTQQMQLAPHVQAGFSLNPSMANYPRPQVPAAAAAAPIGLHGYHPNLAVAAYAAPAAYAGIPGAQYAAVGPASQYGAVPYEYAQYGATAFGMPQVVQTGLHPGPPPAVTPIPPYYTGVP